MVDKRKDDRIAFVSMGLVVAESEKISCNLENVSNHGALLRLNGPVGETLQQGNVLCLQTIFLSPVKFKCEVMRVDATRIAVQFVD